MAGLDVAGIVAELTLEEKASLCLGSDFWHTAPVERLGVPAVMVADGPHGLRKQPDEADHAGLGGSMPGDLLPDRLGAGLVLGRRPARRGRRGARPRGPGRGGRGAARPGRQHQALAAVRPQLRVLLRGPAADRRARRRPSCRGCRARASAPRSSTSPRTTRRPTGSGSAPTSTSARCARSTCRRSSGSSPQAQPWTVMCAYNRLNGIHASQHRWLLTDVLRGRVGVRGAGGVRLGRRARPRGRGRGRPRPRDAAAARAAATSRSSRRCASGALDEAVLDVARAAGCSPWSTGAAGPGRRQLRGRRGAPRAGQARRRGSRRRAARRTTAAAAAGPRPRASARAWSVSSHGRRATRARAARR